MAKKTTDDSPDAELRTELVPAQGAPKKPKLRTPSEWASELGHQRARRLEITLNGREPGARYSSEHRRAATWFGWDEGDLRGDAPLSLTEDQYREALRCASVFETYEPATAMCRRKSA